MDKLHQPHTIYGDLPEMTAHAQALDIRSSDMAQEQGQERSIHVKKSLLVQNHTLELTSFYVPAS